MRKYICGPGQGNLADLDMCEEECNVSEEGQLYPAAVSVVVALKNCLSVSVPVHHCLSLC